jgi:hypothetical protein
MWGSKTLRSLALRLADGSIRAQGCSAQMPPTGKRLRTATSCHSLKRRVRPLSGYCSRSRYIVESQLTVTPTPAVFMTEGKPLREAGGSKLKRVSLASATRNIYRPLIDRLSCFLISQCRSTHPVGLE